MHSVIHMQECAGVSLDPHTYASIWNWLLDLLSRAMTKIQDCTLQLKPIKTGLWPLCICILLHANTSGLQQEYKDVIHMAVVCLIVSSLHALLQSHPWSPSKPRGCLFCFVWEGWSWSLLGVHLPIGICEPDDPWTEVFMLQQHNWSCKVFRHMHSTKVSSNFVTQDAWAVELSCKTARRIHLMDVLQDMFSSKDDQP